MLFNIITHTSSSSNAPRCMLPSAAWNNRADIYCNKRKLSMRDSGKSDISRRGSHRELGRQHGEQATDKIKSHVAKIAADSGYSHAQLRDRAVAFQSLFEKYSPHLLE